MQLCIEKSKNTAQAMDNMKWKQRLEVKEGDRSYTAEDKMSVEENSGGGILSEKTMLKIMEKQGNAVSMTFERIDLSLEQGDKDLNSEIGEYEDVECEEDYSVTEICEEAKSDRKKPNKRKRQPDLKV